MKKRIPIIIILLISGIFASIYALYRWHYPYGIKGYNTMNFLLFAFHAYADDNNGYFPAGGKTPLESLQKLYPKYTSETWVLAGYSGDLELTKKTLEAGGTLDASMSSWVYIPGLKCFPDGQWVTGLDAQEIAVVWGKEEGIGGCDLSQ